MKTITNHPGDFEVRRLKAFTLPELLVVIAVLVTLGGLLPALFRSSRGVQCLDNERQIIQAMLLYCADNQEILPANPDYQTQWSAWIKGDMLSPNDGTNVLYLVDSRFARLGQYTGMDYRIYRCPADKSLSKGVPKLPRVRSYSMVANVGTNPDPAMGKRSPTTSPWVGSGFLRYPTLSSMTKPGPSKQSVIVDEDDLSINDGSFASICDKARLVNYPTYRHHFAAGFAFADGHVEMHRWQNSSGWINTLRSEQVNRFTMAPNDKADWLWMAQRTSWSPVTPIQ